MYKLAMIAHYISSGRKRNREKPPASAVDIMRLMTDGSPKGPPKVAPPYIMYGAMLTGLAASIAFRTLVVIEHINADWVRPVWYFAVLGNFFFFYYRFRISGKRKGAIERNRLLEKIEAEEPLSGDDRATLAYLLHSIKKSPENINYIIISIFSLLAIASDLAFVYLA